jgi:hypothetical protein
MVKPAYKQQAKQTQATSDLAISNTVISQMNPMTKAAAAGEGIPWKNRLSTTDVLTLNLAKRSAAQAQ